MMTATRVLFLCTGNTARSQMAEAFLRAEAGDDYEAYSAGFAPQQINPMAIKVMEERGIDLNSQHAKGLSEYLGKLHFPCLSVCASATNPSVPRPSWGWARACLDWAFEDPAALEGTDEQRLARFREVRDAIEARLREWLEENAARR